jgi:hypothetical protein
MKKSFVSKRTSEGVAVKEDTIEYLRQCSVQAEELHGRYSTESRMARLILAAMHCATEDYESVERLLTGHVAAQKGRDGANPMWMFWALALLFEAYANLNRIPEAMQISKEGRSIAKQTDASAKDPFLEALVHQAIALEAEADSKSRQHGFAVALLTLSWYVSHGFERSRGNAHVPGQLQALFKSYGLGDEDWKWAVKHAHLTKYDFVGLLSILLHHAGQAPARLEPWMSQRVRVIHVR